MINVNNYRCYNEKMVFWLFIGIYIDFKIENVFICICYIMNMFSFIMFV